MNSTQRETELTESHSDSSSSESLSTYLRSLEQTPEGNRWPDATWPTVQAFKDASTFIGKLPLDRIPAPEIYLADDGEVNFLWKKQGVFIDLGFYGDETYSYFARGEDGSKHYGDDVRVSNDFPRDLLNLFTE